MKSTTIRDVARLANVSTATVSRALQQPGKLKKDTLNAVLKVVKDTGFVPNAQARSFRQQSTHSIILLVRDISNPFYLEIFKGAEEAAREAGYVVLMADGRNDEERITEYIELAQQKHADGVILMVGSLPAHILADPDRMPPMVVASEALEGVNLPTVRIDNVRASRSATEYAIGLGHRRIAFLGGDGADYITQNRKSGYCQALEAAGLPVEEALCKTGDYSIASGKAAAMELLEAGEAFTAIIAASDQMAIGAISTLRAAALRVPEDVSVIGFDDIILAEAFVPALTTVHQPRLEMGRRAMEMMVDLLTQGETDPVVELDTELALRDSVAPPSSQRNAQ